MPCRATLYTEKKHLFVPHKYYLALIAFFFFGSFNSPLRGAAEEKKEVILLMGVGFKYEREIFAASLVGKKLVYKKGRPALKKKVGDDLFTHDEDDFTLLNTEDLPNAQGDFDIETATHFWKLLQGESYKGKKYKIKGIVLLVDAYIIEHLSTSVPLFKHFTQLFTKAQIQALAPYVKLAIKDKNAYTKAVLDQYQNLEMLDEESQKLLLLCTNIIQNEKKWIPNKMIFSETISQIPMKGGKVYEGYTLRLENPMPKPDSYTIEYEYGRIASNCETLTTFPEQPIGENILKAMIPPKVAAQAKPIKRSPRFSGKRTDKTLDPPKPRRASSARSLTHSDKGDALAHDTKPRGVTGTPPLGNLGKDNETTTHTSNHIGLKITVVVIVVGGIALGVGYRYTSFLKHEKNKEKKRTVKPKKDLTKKSKPRKKKGKKRKKSNPSSHKL